MRAGPRVASAWVSEDALPPGHCPPRVPAASVLPVVALQGSLVHKTDFQRLLATPPCSRSAHFALHHVAGGPAVPNRPAAGVEAAELSTDSAADRREPVDSSPGGCWLGTVVPKRLAHRAVTRNLLRRQIRAALGRHAGALPGGLWLVRLKAPRSEEHTSELQSH